MSAHRAIETPLAAVDSDHRDRLLQVVDGGAVVSDLTGHQPNRSALPRWAAKGQAGVPLCTITDGKRRCTTRESLLNWFVAIDQAHKSVQPEGR